MTTIDYKDVDVIPVQLKHKPHTDSIILGYEIGSANLSGDRRLGIMASGKIVRFALDGVDGYVDVDLTPLAERALLMLEQST